jgi:hypothetical protein
MLLAANLGIIDQLKQYRLLASAREIYLVKSSVPNYGLYLQLKGTPSISSAGFPFYCCSK